CARERNTGGGRRVRAAAELSSSVSTLTEVTIVPAADLQSEHSLVPQPQPKYTESGSGATGKHQQAHGAALQPFSSSSDTSLHILFLLVLHRLLLPSALLLQRKSAVGNLHLVCEMLPVDWSILFFFVFFLFSLRPLLSFNS
ncbi:hypothetical protein INR49_000515, partial [Caranx melampygus]